MNSMQVIVVDISICSKGSSGGEFENVNRFFLKKKSQPQWFEHIDSHRWPHALKQKTFNEKTT